MKNSELHKIIETWLKDPNNQEHNKNVERSLEKHPQALASFKQLQNDFSAFSGSNKLPENPFFFSKLKFRMETRKQERSHVRRVRWAVYAATMSVSLTMGVLLGNQVEGAQSQSSQTISSSDDIFAEEFLVADYSVDNALQVVITE